MGILTPEIPTSYTAVDSDAFGDGFAGNAHPLRLMTLMHNRLMAKGHPLCSLVWAAELGADESVANGKLQQFAHIGRWREIVPPVYCPKKPGLAVADVRGKIRIVGTIADELLLQFSTFRRPFNEHATAGDSNVVRIVGDGTSTYQDVSLDGLALRRELASERLRIHVRGIRTGRLGDTATNGSPNTGSDIPYDSVHLTSTPPNWNTTDGTRNNYASNGHYVEFVESGADVVAPRTVVYVSTYAGIRSLTLFPPFSAQEIARLRHISGTAGVTFNIMELPEYEIGGIAVYARDRI